MDVSAREPVTARVAAPRRLWVLMGLSAVLLFFDFGAHVLVTNDETRFPVMARDILEHGHWLRPEINGVPMLNKPPVHAWLIALAAWPTGEVSSRTAAIPSLVGALIVVAGAYWIGRRLFQADVGLAAGLISVTMGGVFLLARSPIPDMTMAMAIVAAMVAFVAAEFDGRPGALFAFYLLVGVAFWVKGPAGLLPVAVALGYVLVTDGWSGTARLRSGAGFAVLALMVVGWSSLALADGRSAFVRNVVINDMAHGYFTRSHWRWVTLVEPFAQALAILLPWSLLLPLVLWWAVRRGGTQDERGTRLMLVWVVVVFVFVAISQRQRWRYYLPLCVPVSVLIAAWAYRLRWRRRQTIFAVAWVLVATGLAVGHAVVTARQSRQTDLRAMAAEVAAARGPLYAQDAPEIVFEFHLGKPVIPTSDYDTFARQRQGQYLLAPEWLVAEQLAAEPVRPVAEGRVAGHRFVLLRKR
jgi:4-amino-4-deoxy-L-arabinose transferase-like glycosyltransferase